MPTKRPRVTLTETPDLSRRLALAASRFPDRAGSRGDLLLALTEVAERTLTEAGGGGDRRAAAKRRVIERTEAITSAQADAIIAAREADWLGVDEQAS